MKYLILLTGVVAITMTACSSPDQASTAPDRYQYNRIVMGSQARIIVYSPNEQSARQAVAAAFDRLDELDAVMSDYRSDSELMRLCDLAGGPAVRVSDDLFAVLRRSEAIARASNGAFDVTVGPIVRLWRQSKQTGRLPDAEALSLARSLTGWQRVILNPDDRTVQLTTPGMRLDLGGIGKGFAADAALKILHDSGHRRALVDLGGDLRLGEPPPGRSGWTVSVVSHDPDRPDLRLILADCAVATSGDLEQAIAIDGKRYSHLVNPQTGLGLTTHLAVTVIANDGATADALASAISVLGPVDGLKLLTRFPGASARIVRKTANNLVARQSAAFPKEPR